MIYLEIWGKALQAGLTPMIAILALYVAFQQYRTNREKVRLDLFDRRMAIFDALMQLLRIIGRDGTISNEELVRFSADTNNAVFIVAELSDYLDEIYKHAVDLQYSSNREGEDSVPEGELKELTIKTRDYREWFNQQFKTARTKFSKYLTFVG